MKDLLELLGAALVAIGIGLASHSLGIGLAVAGVALVLWANFSDGPAAAAEGDVADETG